MLHVCVLQDARSTNAYMRKTQNYMTSRGLKDSSSPTHLTVDADGGIVGLPSANGSSHSPTALTSPVRGGSFCDVIPSCGPSARVL